MATIYTLTANDVALSEFWTANGGANRSVLISALEAGGIVQVQKFLEEDRPTTAPISPAALGWEYDTGKSYKASGLAPGDWIAASGGVSDHGALSGLADDDHAQYHNNARGDARYAPLAHASATNNPHSVTKAQVGLANVDNTSDADKPLSNAANDALGAKADALHATGDTLTDSSTIAWDVTGGVNGFVTLQGNRTLAVPLNAPPFSSGTLLIQQDSVGSRTLAYAAGWKFPGGAVPTLSTSANAKDALSWFTADGTTFLATLLKGFA